MVTLKTRFEENFYQTASLKKDLFESELINECNKAKLKLRMFGPLKQWLLNRAFTAELKEMDFHSKIVAYYGGKELYFMVSIKDF